jgi:hypothetical protein
MATDKQIAANRRNAAKSTGPRSAAGKRRAGRNAYRHGLSLARASTPTLSKQLEERARELAGTSEDQVILGLAHAVAAAEFDVDRVRRTKVSLIRCVSAFGDVDPRRMTVRGIIRWLRTYEDSMEEPPWRLVLSAAPKPMPPREPERSAEAIRRCLPHLRKLERYEERAAARLGRAVEALLSCRENRNRA